MQNNTIYILALTLLLITGITSCSDAEQGAKSSASGMKCGAGKCGANMFDGKGALSKKKRNIISQMRTNDPRIDCVKSAKTTLEAYNCVKHKETNRMSLKCGTSKCGEGKCGTAIKHTKMMLEKKAMKKENNTSMKCGANKCGSKM